MQLAVEDRHQPFDDFLVPMLRFAIDKPPQLGNGDRYADLFQPPDEFGYRSYFLLGHHDTDPPSDLSSWLCECFRHAAILSELYLCHKYFASNAKYLQKTVDLMSSSLANCTPLNERRNRTADVCGNHSLLPQQPTHNGQQHGNSTNSNIAAPDKPTRHVMSPRVHCLRTRAADTHESVRRQRFSAKPAVWI